MFPTNYHFGWGFTAPKTRIRYARDRFNGRRKWSEMVKV